MWGLRGLALGEMEVLLHTCKQNVRWWCVGKKIISRIFFFTLREMHSFLISWFFNTRVDERLTET